MNKSRHLENQLYSLILVAIQLSSVGYIFLTSPTLPDNYIYLFLLFAGLILASWSVWIMHVKSVLRLIPEIAQHSKLVTDGPYSVIRHPMYAGLILVTSSLVLDTFSWGRLVAFSLLTCALILKTFYEEKLLVEHFPQYKVYKKKTWYFLPFIF